MAAALMLIGAIALVVGAYLFDPRAALVAGGVLTLLAGADLARRPGGMP